MNEPDQARRLVPMPEALKTLAETKTQMYAKIKAGLVVRPVKVGPRRVGIPSDELGMVLSGRIAGLSDDQMRALVGRLHDSRRVLAQQLTGSACER